MGDRELSSADFQALYERLRRQAQWGRDDRRGALNQVTPDRLLAAASEVRLGRSVTMAAALAGSAADNPEPGARHMKHLPGEFSDVPGLSFAADQMAMNLHGNADSHIDALCHVSYRGELYNGVAPDAVTSQGASELSIDDARDGIAGRGVLLDIPALRGVPWLEPGDCVTAADLAAAQQAQQVDVGPCDLLFVTGLYLLDYLQFEDLLPVCETAGRWSFLCVIAPLRLPGGTGSPVNPIAIL